MLRRTLVPRLCAAGAVAGCVLHKRRRVEAQEKTERVFTAAEVAEHSDEESGVWVSYRGGVYDVSRFVDAHPGGRARIMMAAGGDVSSYFDYWAVHKMPLAQSVLARHRIGRLAKEDRPDDADAYDPYAAEPTRSRELRGIGVASSEQRPYPYIAEPRVLPCSYETPSAAFYVRNHAPVPECARAAKAADGAGAHVVEVWREDSLLRAASLGDLLKRLAPVRLHATLQCTGNRLREMFEALPSEAHAARNVAVTHTLVAHDVARAHSPPFEHVRCSSLCAVRDCVLCQARHGEANSMAPATRSPPP
jgi:predicted heme/steroid binding protein